MKTETEQYLAMLIAKEIATGLVDTLKDWLQGSQEIPSDLKRLEIAVDFVKDVANDGDSRAQEIMSSSVVSDSQLQRLVKKSLAICFEDLLQTELTEKECQRAIEIFFDIRDQQRP